MINADTAMVSDGTFTHYCHEIKSLMILRIHHSNCPMCLQRNPDYISNKLAHTVIDMKTERVVLVFGDADKAVNYVLEHPFDNLALGDTGYVE